MLLMNNLKLWLRLREMNLWILWRRCRWCWRSCLFVMVCIEVCVKCVRWLRVVRCWFVFWCKIVIRWIIRSLFKRCVTKLTCIWFVCWRLWCLVSGLVCVSLMLRVLCVRLWSVCVVWLVILVKKRRRSVLFKIFWRALIKCRRWCVVYGWIVVMC